MGKASRCYYVVTTHRDDCDGGSMRVERGEEREREKRARERGREPDRHIERRGRAKGKGYLNRIPCEGKTRSMNAFGYNVIFTKYNLRSLGLPKSIFSADSRRNIVRRSS